MLGRAPLRLVSKFGGSSVADRECIGRVASFVNKRTAPSVVVVSAPGKRDKGDIKVTDLLLAAHDFAAKKDRAQYDKTMGTIAARFEGLTSTPLASLAPAVERVSAQIYDVASEADCHSSSGFAASRGEYLNGMVMAHETGFELVDPSDEFIIFDNDGKLRSEDTLEAIGRRIAHGGGGGGGGGGGLVVPGFFGGVDGSAEPRHVATFSRGGSDVTASLVAAALAEPAGGEAGGGTLSRGQQVVHENFTDVDGVLSADPRLCAAASRIPRLGYGQTRVLASAGAAVLHPDAVTPLVARGVGIHVRSTWAPEGEGTWVSGVGETLEWAAAFDDDDEALNRAAALAVAGTGSHVTIVTKEMGEALPGVKTGALAPRAERVHRSLRAGMEAAIDAAGIGRVGGGSGAASGGEPLAVRVEIADAAQLDAAVRAVFEGVVA